MQYGQLILRKGNLLIIQWSGQSSDLQPIMVSKPCGIYFIVDKFGSQFFLNLKSIHQPRHNQGIQELSSNVQMEYGRDTDTTVKGVLVQAETDTANAHMQSESIKGIDEQVFKLKAFKKDLFGVPGDT